MQEALDGGKIRKTNNDGKSNTMATFSDMSEDNRVRKREGESVNISQETKKTLRSLESLEPADLKLAKQSRKREKGQTR